MMLLLSFFLIIVGLIGLWFAGDFVIQSALKLAARYRLTTAFVGFVLLALAANIPELAVAIMAALHGASQISAGDILGANFSDVALVSGFTLCFAQSLVLHPTDIREMLRTLIMASLVMIFVLYIGNLHPYHGYAFIACYLFFVAWSWLDQQRTTAPLEHPELDEKPHTLQHTMLLWIYFLGSISLVLGCSTLTVQGALHFAQACGMRLETIGATILAFGTSLPEITIGINALRRKEYALALGPTIGTVFAQATLTLGTLSILSSTPINLHALTDTACFMFAAFSLLIYALIKNYMGKKTGIALLCLFLIYISYHVAVHIGLCAIQIL